MPAAPTSTVQASTGRGAGTAGEQGAAPRDQPATAEAPAAPQPAAPPAAPAPILTPLAQRAAPLHQAPRAVAQVLQVAVERGISHAKLNLRPAEFGGIEIRLQTSAAGVTAQVLADSPEAARLLHQAADELRRALERHDVTLLSLDVSTAGDGRPDGSAGASSDPAADRARHFAAHGLTPKAAEADEPPAVVETIQLNDGVHVDVLA
jgi:flagellar hook-length control protein FliK